MAVRLMHEHTGRGAARSRRTCSEVELVLRLRRALITAMGENLITSVAARSTPAIPGSSSTWPGPPRQGDLALHLLCGTLR
jgi:hypothetical protein